jgi:hypothetical protein
MFVGWIRKDSFSSDLEELSQDILIDKNLVLNTFEKNPSLTFGIYDGNKLRALIGAYEFEKQILINSFYYTKNVSTQAKKKLIDLLLTNLEILDKTVLFLSKVDELKYFESFEFKKYETFTQAVYSGGAVFDFPSSMDKSISNKDYLQTIKNIDKKVFNEDRFEYITNAMMKNSSLVLSTQSGFLHSYALDKSTVKISPFVISDEFSSDTEKFIRGLIYHRGLKRLIAYIPKAKEGIVSLFDKYKFKLDGEYYLVYKNNKPNIDIDLVYGL